MAPSMTVASSTGTAAGLNKDALMTDESMTMTSTTFGSDDLLLDDIIICDNDSNSNSNSSTNTVQVDVVPDALKDKMGSSRKGKDGNGKKGLPSRTKSFTISLSTTSAASSIGGFTDDDDDEEEQEEEQKQDHDDHKESEDKAPAGAVSIEDKNIMVPNKETRRSRRFSSLALQKSILDKTLKQLHADFSDSENEEDHDDENHDAKTMDSSHLSIMGQSTQAEDYGYFSDNNSNKTTDGRRRRSSTVRFGSIVLNEIDLEALQEEIELATQEKSWWQRRQELGRRRQLEHKVTCQLHTLHKAHKNNTLLHKIPDEREETKKLTTTCYPSPTGEGLSVSIKFTGKESQSFYKAMQSFSAFKDITKDEYFRVAPLDWHVVITDVKGSTKAIESGRYRDVNTVGAASISVVMQLLDDDFPFVFGGDGATLLIPPTDIGRVLEVLLRLQRLSEEQFHLGLRVGHISVGDVIKAGGTIEIAKHELTAGRCIAVFRGGGLTVAEACIKGQESKYCLQWKSCDDVELGGLSCRWNEIPNKRGKVMSLLVCAREGEPPTEVYNHVIQELDKIYDGKLDEANPVNSDLMYYKTVGQCYEDEKRFHTNKWSSSYVSRIAEIFLAVGIFKHGFDPKFFDQKHYFESMRPHADHRKFDDMLRMIIDCSEEQAEAIEELMEELYMDQKLHYGIFLSDTALMTCYLEDLVDGQHIHFIDGGDGGYAMAAKQLKAQLKSDLLAGA